MNTIRSAFPLARWTLALAVSLLVPALAGRPVAAREAGRQQAKIDPQADQVLHQMSDYLKGLKSFKVQGHAVEQIVLPSGQKIDKLRYTEASVLRPNHLKSRQMGPGGGLAFNYDGTAMTLYCEGSNSYATVPAPDNFEAALDEARTKMHIEAPGGKLVSSNPYEMLTGQVTSGTYIGKESVYGVTAHHIALRGTDMDSQIWIQDGPQPLPLRYEMTSKTAKGQPTASVTLTNWQPQANLTDAEFKFQPPKGASKVDEVPADCGGAQQQQQQPQQQRNQPPQ